MRFKKALPQAPRSSEAGYNMVVLMVAVTVLTIFTAAALPMWSHAMQREKEEELISRGWQYAEAIRVFQQRHGRYPTRLKELIEVKPRSIRKLWEDPMSDDGAWGLVFQGVGATPLPGQTGPDGRPRPPGRSAPRGGEQETIGPIVGVHSRSKDEAIKTLFGEDSYDKWLFTVERLTNAVGRSQVGFGQGRTTPEPILPKTKWLGRPFREGLEVPQGGGLPPGSPVVPVGSGPTGPDDQGPADNPSDQ
jgi:type II secretory pathway pseudopilin PulG